MHNISGRATKSLKKLHSGPEKALHPEYAGRYSHKERVENQRFFQFLPIFQNILHRIRQILFHMVAKRKYALMH